MHKVPVCTYKFYFMLALGSDKLFSVAYAVVNIITENTVLIERVLAPDWRSCKRKLLCFTVHKD